MINEDEDCSPFQKRGPCSIENDLAGEGLLAHFSGHLLGFWVSGPSMIRPSPSLARTIKALAASGPTVHLRSFGCTWLCSPSSELWSLEEMPIVIEALEASGLASIIKALRETGQAIPKPSQTFVSCQCPAATGPLVHWNLWQLHMLGTGTGPLELSKATHVLHDSATNYSSYTMI